MAKRKSSQKAKKSSKKAGFDLKEYFSGFWSERSPALRFLSIFIFCMLAFYVFYFSSFFAKNFHPLIINTQAKIGSFLIGLLGGATAAAGSVIEGGGFSMDISGGCDGIEVTAILVAGILAFPAKWKNRFKGIFYGSITLAVLNILRFPILYFAGLNGSVALFDFLHIQGGFIIFVTLTVIIWSIWVDWTTKKEAVIIQPENV